MALLVLLTSTGLTTYAHACRIHGTVKVSLYAPKPCCKVRKNATSALQRASCCQIKAQYQHVPVAPSPAAGTYTVAPVVAILPAVPPGVPPTAVVRTRTPLRYQHSPAPPLAGRARLVRLQTFLI
jgi:hypothetical protein